MKQHLLQVTRYNYASQKLRKFQLRLQKSINSGAFNRFSRRKKNALYQRIERLKKQVQTFSLSLKIAVSSGALVLGIGVFNDAQGQFIVTEKTGVDNPFSEIQSSNSYLQPTFSDIDDDGDPDLFIGDHGAFKFYRNNGALPVPSFTEETGANNPLDIFGSNPPTGNSYGESKVSFADIDDDNDLDALVSVSYGTGSSSFWVETRFYTYINNGDNQTPNFERDTINPLLDGVGQSLSPNAVATFVDLDGDSDYDLVVGNGVNGILYYKNTGTAASAEMTLISGSKDTFSGINAGYSYHKPTFADLDDDTDLDLLVTGYYDYDNTFYYENTGSAEAPVFTLNNANSGLENHDLDAYLTATMADVDSDGDDDILIGELNGITGDFSFRYFENDRIITASENREALEIAVYPNPASDKLTIQMDENIAVVRCYSVDGQLLIEDRKGGEIIDVQSLNKGIYLLNVEMVDGSQLSQKFTIE